LKCPDPGPAKPGDGDIRKVGRGLFHAADSGLTDAHAAGEFDLGELRGLAERPGMRHRVGVADEQVCLDRAGRLVNSNG
jgi:hypothetical protein